MKLLARTVAPPAAVRVRLPAAAVSDDGVLELDVPPAEWTFRCLEVANAVDELEGRPVLTHDDSSTSVDIAAPTDEVFESLTDPELFERWFGLPFEIELYAGGRWSIGAGGPTGTVVELVADHLVVLAEDTGTSTWRMSEVDYGTRLSVTMRSPSGGPPPPASWHGWLSGITQLRRLHEVPDRCPIWLL